MKELLSAEVQKFIRDHEHGDEKAILLKHKLIGGVSASRVVDQIVGRRKAKDKLPSFHANENIIYPPGLNLEQSSSEKTASYKADFLSKEVSVNNTLLDLTGGFGVDSFFFSKYFTQADYIEPNEDLLNIAKQNHDTLGAKNIVHHHATAEDFLSTNDKKFDVVYIDPSRRSSNNRKVFSLQDCVPDIVSLQDKIFLISENLIVKTSPLLDLQLGLRELKFVKKILVISFDNECKEVVFVCEVGFRGVPEILAVNLSRETEERFTFTFPQEQSSMVSYSDPQKFIYEPNASVLKAGAFKSISNQFRLDKIQVNTHLYTSDLFQKDFPGRIFEIESIVKPDPKNIRAFFPEMKANVTTRNYPLSVEELKKKTSLKDGGDKYLIGFSGERSKFLVVAKRLK